MSYSGAEIYKIFTKNDLIYENINVNNIKVFLNGDIEIELINSYNGQFLKNIICSGFIFFNFIPEKNNEKHCAIFALEMYCKKLIKSELELVLSHFNVNMENIEEYENYSFLNIFSGDMDINIICNHVVFADERN